MTLSIPPHGFVEIRRGVARVILSSRDGNYTVWRIGGLHKPVGFTAKSSLIARIIFFRRDEWFGRYSILLFGL